MSAAMIDKSSALQAVSRIDGWLSDLEAEALYDFARAADGPIVEIGSWQGRSTAALAHGSMAGNGHDIYAVDCFAPAKCVVTGEPVEASSPELLRSNLDAAGVNGLVKIVPHPSQNAVSEIPNEIGLLFVDGAHDYESVKRDILLFAPRVKAGGTVVLHDVIPEEPGVLQALDETLIADSANWQPLHRVNTAVVFRRRASTARHKIMLGMPGPNLKFVAARGLLQASRGNHDVRIEHSGNGWDDMEELWIKALNSAKRGEITHFAMLHSDISPSVGWLDILAEELDRLGGDMISTAVAIKDSRGLTSCGIGDASDRWNPFRRFTIRELCEMPETFNAAETPHPDKYLLHNTACWIADLRNPQWWKTDENGFLLAVLNFPVAAKLNDDGTVQHLRESEDWYFSRKVAEIGLKTFITRKVRTTHYGDTGYDNFRPWGDYLFGDQDTKQRWGTDA